MTDIVLPREPESDDDAAWKREVLQALRALAAKGVAHDSAIDYLKGRVN